jgi:predicted CXXCH cytochrome family protein
MIACGALWLILAAIPALADGGPHVKTDNNGSLGITADGCAGCHRVHTAQGPLLLKTATEEALCLSCHGAAVAGSTVDVMTGIQYRLGTGAYVRDGTGDPNAAPSTWVNGTQLGALRGGGFEEARIGDPFRYTIAGSTGSATRLGKVQVASAPDDVTSAHIPGLAGLTQPGVAWGNGANGSGVGPVATVSCGSCHNPHGNGQYRILNTLPTAIDSDTVAPQFSNAWVVKVFDYGVVVATNVYRSVSSMGVLNGDTVSVAGNSNPAANVTGTITMVDGDDSGSTPDDNLFTLQPIGVASTTSGTGGTATRGGGTKVTDADLPPAGDTRNYTVIQTNTTFALVGFGAGTYTTSLAHNFAVGDFVTVARMVGTPACPSGSSLNPGINCPNTTAKVATVGANTFTLSGVTYAGTGTGGSAIGKNETLLASQAQAYSITAGDYFHYRVPWNGLVTTLDNPNGVPGGSTPQSIFQGGFGEQIAAFCASCHTRYWAWQEPTEDTADGAATGPAYENPRPGDPIFTYQHRTRGASGRGCLTCHVSHGSNAVMDGPNSSTFTFPNGTPSANSRLLKVDNRGTCQQCHDPTGTSAIGDQWPKEISPGVPYPVPSVP